MTTKNKIIWVIIFFFTPWILMAAFSLLSLGGMNYYNSVNSDEFGIYCRIYWLIGWPLIIIGIVHSKNKL